MQITSITYSNADNNQLTVETSDIGTLYGY